MFKKPFMTITILVAATILNSCNTDFVKSDQANRASRVFFMYLANGDYIMATAFFAGNYEALAVLNPDLDPADHAALWQRGCQINGLKCLAIRTARFIRNGDSGEYIFRVEFSNPDDSLFTLSACCSKDALKTVKSQFEYRVLECKDREFRVLDLPVYVP